MLTAPSVSIDKSETNTTCLIMGIFAAETGGLSVDQNGFGFPPPAAADDDDPTIIEAFPSVRKASHATAVTVSTNGSSTEDSVWGGHFDDFSLSVCRQQQPGGRSSGGNSNWEIPISRTTDAPPPTTNFKKSSSFVQLPPDNDNMWDTAEVDALEIDGERDDEEDDDDDNDSFVMPISGFDPDDYNRVVVATTSRQRVHASSDILFQSDCLVSPHAPISGLDKFNKSFGDLPGMVSLGSSAALVTPRKTSVKTSAAAATPRRGTRTGVPKSIAMTAEDEVSILAAPLSSKKKNTKKSKSGSPNNKKSSSRNTERANSTTSRRSRSSSRNRSMLDTAAAARASSSRLRDRSRERSADAVEETGTRRRERSRDRSTVAARISSRKGRRSRSQGPLDDPNKYSVQIKSSNKKERDRSSRLDRSVEPVTGGAFTSRSHERSLSPTKRIRPRRGFGAPQRSKSNDDVCFSSAIGDLQALGIDLGVGNMNAYDGNRGGDSNFKRTPLSRTKSMNENAALTRSRALGLGLNFVDQHTPSTNRSKRRVDETSMGSGSRSSGGTSSRTSDEDKHRRGSHRSKKGQLDAALVNLDKKHGSITSGKRKDEKSVLSGESASSRRSSQKDEHGMKGRRARYSNKYVDDNDDEASEAIEPIRSEKMQKDEMKLAREKRKAEEARLKRLQEESKLLEEKRRAEEARLKILQEETRLLEFRRLEEEARAEWGAKKAEEQHKAEETRLVVELKEARPKRQEEEDRLEHLREGSRIAQEQLAKQQTAAEAEKEMPQADVPPEESSSGANGERDRSTSTMTSKPEPHQDGDIHSNGCSRPSEWLGGSAKSEASARAPKRMTSLNDRIAKFSGPGSAGTGSEAASLQLPPAFQLLRKQSLSQQRVQNQK